MLYLIIIIIYVYISSMKSIIYIVATIQLLFSMTIVNADNNETNCYIFDNETVCMEEIPCKHCDLMIDPNILGMDIIGMVDIDM